MAKFLHNLYRNCTVTLAILLIASSAHAETYWLFIKKADDGRWVKGDVAFIVEKNDNNTPTASELNGYHVIEVVMTSDQAQEYVTHTEDANNNVDVLRTKKIDYENLSDTSQKAVITKSNLDANTITK